jgi:cell division protein FtsB
MTFIQPSKNKNIVNLIIAGLLGALFLSTFWVIIAYNQTVSLSHDIAKTKAELDSIGAANTKLNNDLLATLGGGRITAIAQANNLVEEKKPEYFPLTQKWPIASQ